jgi:hypothetical protein
MLPSAQERSVLLIVLDGLRTEESCGTDPSPVTGQTGAELLPFLWGSLAPQAAVYRHLLNTGITFTGPSHAYLVSGRMYSYLNLEENDNKLSRMPYPYPNLFHDLTAANRSSAIVANTTLLGGLPSGSYPATRADTSYTMVESTIDTPVLDALKTVISSQHPDFTLVNLHLSDRKGHAGVADVFTESVETQDAILADLYAWLQAEEPEYYKNMLLVITSDHGRHLDDIALGWVDHGDGCQGCRQVGVWMAGPYVKAQELTGTWTQADLNATMAAWLGVKHPYGTGRLMEGVIPGLKAPIRSGVEDEYLQHQVRMVWDTEGERRNHIEAGGQILSSENALLAEAPVLYQGAREWLCFRELAIDPRRSTGIGKESALSGKMKHGDLSAFLAMAFISRFLQ